MVIAQIVMNGLLLGCLYATIAAGFSLVWGVLNIINIMHGSVVVLGSYVALFAWQKFGVHPMFAIVIAAPLLFALGWILQRAVIQRVVAAPVLITLVLTFGLDLILNNGMLAVFSADYQKVDAGFNGRALSFVGISVPIDRLMAAVVAVVTTLLLHLYLHRSRLGKAIVAVRMDRQTAELMGVQVEKIYALTFGLGLATAGLAGCLLGAVFPISPLTSHSYLGVAFVACVLGGLGSIVGALVGGILLGLIESLGAFFIGPEYGVTVAAAVLIVTLLVRPQGLFGKAAYA